MREFDAVVFDMDGVIFDSERGMMGCWLELAEEYGIRDMEKTYLACIGSNGARTKRIVRDAYGEDFPFDAFAQEASRRYHERFDGGRLPLKPGVPEILEFLEKSGKRIALASSTRRQTVEDQLRWANIRSYFGAVITGDMVEKSKPEPDIFLRACEEICTAPRRTYAIEDSFNGIRAAAAGKLRPLMVPDILPADGEMRRLAEAVLGSLTDVILYWKGE